MHHQNSFVKKTKKGQVRKVRRTELFSSMTSARLPACTPMHMRTTAQAAALTLLRTYPTARSLLF